MAKNYSILYGYSANKEFKIHNVKELAEFICTEGKTNDLIVRKEDGEFLLNTFGIYIDRISDMEYRGELLKVLIPMQQELDGTKKFLEMEYAELTDVSKKADDYSEKIQNNVDLEYTAFKNEKLQESKDDIFEDSGIIHFYKEVHNFFSGNDLTDAFDLPELIILSDCKDKLISILYEEYLSKEQLSIATWDNIREIIDSYLK